MIACTTKPILKTIFILLLCCYIAIIMFIVISVCKVFRSFRSLSSPLPPPRPAPLSTLTILYVCLVFLLFFPRERETLEFVKIDIYSICTLSLNDYGTICSIIRLFYFIIFHLCCAPSMHDFVSPPCQSMLHNRKAHQSIFLLCIVEIVSLNRQ